MQTTPLTPTCDEDRNWAIYAHAAALLVMTNVPFANILAPLSVYLRTRERLPFAAAHARESLNIQLTYTLIVVVAILGLIASYLSRSVWALPEYILYIVFGYLGFTLLDVVVSVFGAVAAAAGRPFRFPGAIRFLR